MTSGRGFSVHNAIHMKTRGSYEKYNPATGQSDWSNTLSYAISVVIQWRILHRITQALNTGLIRCIVGGSRHEHVSKMDEASSSRVIYTIDLWSYPVVLMINDRS